MMGVLYFCVAAFVALLVHELGHGFLGRRLIDKQMEIRLSFLGGRCSTTSDLGANLKRSHVLLTVLGGPLAGVLWVLLLGGAVCVVAGSLPAGAELCWRMLRGEVPMEYAGICPPLLLLLMVYLLQISVTWTLLNLLPIFPLDGGLLMHEVLASSRGLIYGVSMVATLGLAMLFFATGVWALSLLMVVLAFYNYRCIFAQTK